jgi:hypothetical protein
LITIKNATAGVSKKFLGPVHLHPKTDKWDYLRSPIMKKKMFLVLTSGKFLEALGSGIGTGSIFCLSFSLSNRVHYIGPKKTFQHFSNFCRKKFPGLIQGVPCTY